MILTVSGVVLLGIIESFLIRYQRTTLVSAVVAVVFGFLLASTGAAPVINHFLSDIAARFNHHA